MRKIIDGKVYDSDTAELLCDYSNNLPSTDFKVEYVSLYRTKKGAFFLYGRGGASTDWRRQNGERRSWREGEDIRLLTTSNAKQWLEQHGTTEDFVSVFGEAVEG